MSVQDETAHYKLSGLDLQFAKALILGLQDWKVKVFVLTHLCLVDSSTSSLWTGPIPIEGGLVSFYYYNVL